MWLAFPQQQRQQGTVDEEANRPPEGGKSEQEAHAYEEGRWRPISHNQHRSHARSHQPMPNVIFDITVMEPSTTIDKAKEIKHDDKETHERTDNRKDSHA